MYTNLALAYSASRWANVLCSLEVHVVSTDDVPVDKLASGRLRIFTYIDYQEYQPIYVTTKSV